MSIIFRHYNLKIFKHGPSLSLSVDHNTDKFSKASKQFQQGSHNDINLLYIWIWIYGNIYYIPSASPTLGDNEWREIFIYSWLQRVEPQCCQNLNRASPEHHQLKTASELTQRLRKITNTGSPTVNTETKVKLRKKEKGRSTTWLLLEIQSGVLDQTGKGFSQKYHNKCLFQKIKTKEGSLRLERQNKNQGTMPKISKKFFPPSENSDLCDVVMFS